MYYLIQILVEMGSYAGHRLIQEAKDYILLVSYNMRIFFLDLRLSNYFPSLGLNIDLD
jgi:hypothetical protein